MITNKKKFFGSILGVILFTIVVLAFSYASYIWKSEDTIVTFDINDSYFYCESGIEVVLNGLSPVLDYRSGSYQTFKVNNIGRTATRFSLSLNVTNIDDSLKSESFKYKLMVDKTGGSNNCADVNNSNCIEVEGGSGNFSSIKTGMNTLVSSIEIPNNIRYQYYLFMYIDGNMENDVSMQNSSITSTLDVCETVVFLNYNGGSGNKEFLKVTSTYEGLPTPTRDNSVVTYQTNGGSSVSSETITYTFDGWYLEEDFQTRITASSTVTTPTNHTLYAKWIASKSITLPTTTKTGSTFNGWYSDSRLTSKVGNAGQTYNPVSSITLYAKWAKNTYTIAYTLNGGTKGTNAPTSGTYDT
ncbi:MAG: InlB B-repeat-containing protein, partial [Erysipelotrichaceae bacterium]|nr:InlB B-repeat-containing protein [Erysipelotrichaceae bacterium]